MRLLQKGNTLILVLILVVVLLGSAFLYFRDYSGSSSADKTSETVTTKEKMASPAEPQFKTYSNSKYGFSIQYPDTLAVREFPDTGDGAGFRPANTAEDPGNEVITISVLEKNAAMADDPLSDYAKGAAIIQIQNYEKLNSIESVVTNSGLTGYKTTWTVMPLATLDSTGSGQLTVSEPITYFDATKAQMPSTVQVSLSDQNYASDYEAMIKSFSE